MRSRTTIALQTGLLALIVAVAFVMQVVPFLLVLTLLNLAIGISSTTMLVVIPLVLFAMLIVACVFAERRRRKWRAPHTRLQPRDQRGDAAMAGTQPCLLPFLRWRNYC